jgi:hypothetical protein
MAIIEQTIAVTEMRVATVRAARIGEAIFKTTHASCPSDAGCKGRKDACKDNRIGLWPRRYTLFSQKPVSSNECNRLI